MTVITAPSSRPMRWVAPSSRRSPLRVWAVCAPASGRWRSPPVRPPTPHELTDEEIFVVLEGAAAVTIDGDASSAGVRRQHRGAARRAVCPGQRRRADPAAALLPAGGRTGAAARWRAVHAAVGDVTSVRDRRGAVVAGTSGSPPRPVVRHGLPTSGGRPARAAGRPWLARCTAALRLCVARLSRPARRPPASSPRCWASASRRRRSSWTAWSRRRSYGAPRHARTPAPSSSL